MSLNFGAEIEFYYSGPMELLQKYFHDLSITKENGKNQYEVHIPVFDNMDPIIAFIENWKTETLALAKSSSHFVSFMSKPYKNQPGSSMQFHIKLLKPDNPKLLDFAIKGMCDSMLCSMIHFAPHPESYMRFQHPDIHTPLTVSWGQQNNRSVAIRKFSKLNQLEHRVAGSDCNPKSALVSILTGFIIGIAQKKLPPQPIYGVASDAIYNAPKLPTSKEEEEAQHASSDFPNDSEIDSIIKMIKSVLQ